MFPHLGAATAVVDIEMGVLPVVVVGLLFTHVASN